MSFNPFRNDISSLAQSDLKLLVENGVSEGYFVEYKREPPASKKIAKSIASFANSYGGWYIIGVKANTDNVATEICGFSRALMNDPIAAIRDSCISNISPSVSMEIQVVEISDDDIVVVVKVFDNQDTPFICNDGRVYRRNQDSSEPVHENDRHSFDEIIKKGKRNAELFDEFCVDERVFAKEQKDIPWLKIYISPHPRIEDLGWDLTSSVRIKEFLEYSSKPMPIITDENGDILISGNKKFDSATLAGGSVSFNNYENNSLRKAPNTIQIDALGRSKIFIPMEIARISDSHIPSMQKANYLLWEKLGDDYMLFSPINMAKLLIDSIMLTTFYKNILSTRHSPKGFKIRVVADGLWRTIPALSMSFWEKFVNECGVPINYNDSSRVPIWKNGSMDYDFDKFGPFSLGSHISHALGLPDDVYNECMPIIISRWEKYWDD